MTDTLCNRRPAFSRVLAAAAAAGLGALTLALAGCGLGTATGTGSTAGGAAVSASLSGHVRGGNQPISGAVVQLYAVGTTGLKSQATPLLTSTAVTDQYGNFNITGDWNCTSNTAVYGTNPLLYIVASGGNPGLTSGTNNPAVNMMAALGPCSSVNASTFIDLNELTTLATAYALAPFTADYAHIGASGANATGLVNAFATAALLVNVASGTAPGSLPANATAPVNEINTLGDILSGCVNSTGIDGTCAALFTAATPSGGTKPSDIVGVVLNLAANPASIANAVFARMPTFPAFQPSLYNPPQDWTLALKFTGGGLASPAGLAVDAAGDIWVANAAGNSITELSSTGTPLTGASGYTGSHNILGPQGIAVDRSGNVWVADTLLSSVVELNLSAGTIQSSTSFTAGGIQAPTALAIDSQNNIWVSNFGGASVTELSSAGVALGNSPLTAGGTLQAPYGIAVDTSGNVWVSDNQASLVAEFANNQSLLSGSGYTDGDILAPEGVALDASSRAWIADNGSNAASYLQAAAATAPTPFTGGGLAMPAAVAVDGNGTIWIANNQASGSITKIAYGTAAPLSPSTGLATLNAPAAIAVDPSGNIWTANAGDNSVTEIIGIAAPTTQPLAATAGP
jgi:streptogramin lyase